MLPKFDATEARLIGCLMEKSVTTPNQMPLTLNAVTNAANQKSAREPVMSLTQAEVQHAARGLASRSLLRIEENFKSGIEKYNQRVFGTGPFADIQLTQAQFAIVTLLLLRGPQTPGELRSRSGRLHEFANNEAVAFAARELIDEDNAENDLLVQLPRVKGRKEAEFMHQLCGPVDLAAYAEATSAPRQSDNKDRIAELNREIEALKTENAELREEVEALRKN